MKKCCLTDAQEQALLDTIWDFLNNQSKTLTPSNQIKNNLPSSLDIYGDKWFKALFNHTKPSVSNPNYSEITLHSILRNCIDKGTTGDGRRKYETRSNYWKSLPNNTLEKHFDIVGPTLKQRHIDKMLNDSKKLREFAQKNMDQYIDHCLG